MRLEDFEGDRCAKCGEPFEARRYDQRFCCRTCKRAFEDRERNAGRSEALRKARSGYVCPECGKAFDAKYLATQIYCSKRCKTREMLRRYRARLGEDEFQKRRRQAGQKYKANLRQSIKLASVGKEHL